MHQTISNLETWVIGTLGTCNYVESNGKQVRLYSSDPSKSIILLCVFNTFSTTLNRLFEGVRRLLPSTAERKPDGQRGELRRPSNALPWRCISDCWWMECQQRRISFYGDWPIFQLLVYAKEIIVTTTYLKVGIVSNGKVYCGGSLLDDIHVLTAAHCVHRYKWIIYIFTSTLLTDRTFLSCSDQGCLRKAFLNLELSWELLIWETLPWSSSEFTASLAIGDSTRPNWYHHSNFINIFVKWMIPVFFLFVFPPLCLSFLPWSGLNCKV